MASFSIPSNLLYASTHEWCDVQEEVVTVGITDYAQDQLSDVVFVELPEIGEEFAIGQTMATVESVKAAADIYAPIEGRVIEVNNELQDTPEAVNVDPYGSWFLRMTIEAGADNPDLLDANAYQKVTEN